MNAYLRLLAAGFVLAVAPAAARAEFLIALTTNNSLISFDSGSPEVSGPEVAITGLAGGDSLVAIDYRPANRVLYALNSTGTTVYSIAPGGAATAIPLSATLNGTFFGFDFNPVADRLRVVSDTGFNYSIDVGTGTVTPQDPLEFPASGDVNSGATPLVVASAYTNSFAGATNTTLYGIHAEGGYLVTQIPPASGDLNTVGPAGAELPLGPFTTLDASFDISGRTGVGFAVLNGLSLTRINFVNGRVRELGEVDSPAFIVGLAVVPTVASVPAPPAVVLLGTGLVTCAVGRRFRRRS